MNEKKEAAVIGSGFAGAVAALRLAQAGYRVTIFERGRRFEKEDFPVYPERNIVSDDEDSHPENTVNTLPADFSRWFWKLDNGLIDYQDLGAITVVQGAALGGGSQIYANVHLRPPKDVFSNRTEIAQHLQGEIEGWPSCYGSDAGESPPLERYFEVAAYKMGVQTLPERERNGLCRTYEFKRACSRVTGTEIKHFFPPLSVNFDTKEGPTCDMRGYCMLLCKKQAKNVLTSDSEKKLAKSYFHDLRDPITSENVEIRTLTEVVRIGRNQAEKTSRYVVYYRDLLTTGRRTVRGALSERNKKSNSGAELKKKRFDYVFLSAGTTSTVEMLFESVNKRHEDRIQLTTNACEMLGKNFFTNVDEYAAVFECEKHQEASRGPTITSSIVYKTSKEYPGEGASGKKTVNNYYLVQDAGVSRELEPFLGLFQSPLWYGRNKYEFETGWEDKTAEPGEETRSEFKQKPPYQQLPFDKIRQVIVGVPGENINYSRIVAQGSGMGPSETNAVLSQSSGAKDTGVSRDTNDSVEDKESWSLLPKVLETSIKEDFRDHIQSLQDQLGPQIGGILDRIAEEMAHSDYGFEQILEKFDLESFISKGDIKDQKLERRLLTFVIQMFQGSESEMAGYLIDYLLKQVQPDRVGKLVDRLFQLATWLMDFRVPNDRSTILLGMGLDTRPGELFIHKKTAKLQAKMPAYTNTEERRLQEHVFKLLANQGYKGKLRTNPVSKLLGKTVTVHPQGGAVMAVDGRGVTDELGNVNELMEPGSGNSGIYVMDASNFPTPVGVNPSATILAVAEYKMDRILNNLKGVKGTTESNCFELRDPERKAVMDTWIQRLGDELDPINKMENVGDLVSQSVDSVFTPISLSFREKMNGSWKELSGNREPGEWTRSEFSLWDRIALYHGNFVNTDFVLRIKDLRRYLDTYKDPELSDGIVPHLELGLLDSDDGKHRVDQGTDKAENSFVKFSDRTLVVSERASFVKLFIKGSSNLIKDTDGTLFVYWLVDENSGDVFYGEKYLADEPGVDFWSDTSTLFFKYGQLRDNSRLANKSERFDPSLSLGKMGDWMKQYCEWSRVGTIRLSPDQFFGDQIRNMQVEHAGDPDEASFAYVAFMKFFAEKMGEVYGDHIASTMKRFIRLVSQQDIQT